MPSLREALKNLDMTLVLNVTLYMAEISLENHLTLEIAAQDDVSM